MYIHISPRPFVPTFAERYLNINNLADPGVAASLNLIASRYIRPNMQWHIKEWIKSCSACHRSKVDRRIKTRLITFALPYKIDTFSHRFDRSITCIKWKWLLFNNDRLIYKITKNGAFKGYNCRISFSCYFWRMDT